MRVLAIAIKDTLITFRDKKALIMIILMPLVLIGILGASFGQVFSKSSDLGEFNVAVVNLDHGQMAEEITKLLDNKDIKKLIKTNAGTAGKANQEIREGKIVATLIIPENFTTDVMAGKKARLEIIGDPGKAVKAGIFKGIIDRFAAGVSGVTVGMMTTTEQLASSGNPQVIPALSGKIVADLQQNAEKPAVQIKNETTEGNKELGSFQYYAAGMGVMFMLFAGLLGTKSIIEERNNYTLMRMMAAPTKNATIISGKFAGMVFTVFLQVLVMILLTRLIYGVHWGSSYLGIAVIALAAVFAVAGMSMFIASISRSERSADMIAGIGIQVTSLLGGSMVPVHNFPKFVQNLSNLTVNKWAIQGFTDLMLNKGLNTVIQPTLMLLVIGTVFLAIGTWRLKLN